MAEFRPRYTLEQYLKTSKNKTYFVAAITFLFLLVILIGGVIPAFSSVLGQFEENKKRDEGILQLETKLNTLKNLTLQESEKAETLEIFDNVFSNQLDQKDAVSEINQLATLNNLVLRSITFAEAGTRRQTPDAEFAVTPNVQAQEVGFSIQGDKDSILKFMDSLENSKRIYNIVNVSFQVATDQQTGKPISNNIFMGSFKVEYFWRESLLEQ